MRHEHGIGNIFRIRNSDQGIRGLIWPIYRYRLVGKGLEILPVVMVFEILTYCFSCFWPRWC